MHTPNLGGPYIPCVIVEKLLTHGETIEKVGTMWDCNLNQNL